MSRLAEHRCPICDGSMRPYPVLLRLDNQIHICSPCGTRDTMLYWKLGSEQYHTMKSVDHVRRVIRAVGW